MAKQILFKGSGGGGSGTVTSVGITSTDGSAVITGSPVTGAGNINISAKGLLYPANQIVFGDGVTHGGITNSNLTFNGTDFSAKGAENFPGFSNLLEISDATASGSLKIVNNNFDGYNGIVADATGLHLLNAPLDTQFTWTMPSTIGAANQLLTTNGSNPAQLSWNSIAAGTGISISGLTITNTAPSQSYTTTQVVVGNGSIGGTSFSSFTWNDSIKTLIAGAGSVNLVWSASLHQFSISEAPTVGLLYNGISSSGTPAGVTGMSLDLAHGFYSIGDNAATPNAGGARITISDSGRVFAIDNTAHNMLVGINTVNYLFPTSNSSGVLTNNGSGTLTWAASSGWGTPTGTLYRTALTDSSTQGQFNQALQALITDLKSKSILTS